jgi:TolB protein
MPNERQSRREILVCGATAAACTLLACTPNASIAQTGGRGPAPLALAVPDFVAGTPAEREVSGKMNRIVVSDLKRSGLFELLESSDFARKFAGDDTSPQFADWIALKARGLVTGHVTIQIQKLRSEMRLWDVLNGKLLMAKLYVSKPEDWRQVAHNMAHSIRDVLTGSIR